MNLHGLQLNITTIIDSQTRDQHYGMEHVALNTDDYTGTLARLRANGVTPQKLDALHSSIIEEVNRDGQRWISSATVNGQNVIRTMVISYLTEERHLKGLQASLGAACRKLGLEPASNAGEMDSMFSGSIPLTSAPIQNLGPA